MAILAKWNFNNNTDTRTSPSPSEGLRQATSTSLSGGGLGNVAFGLVGGTDYGWEARNWSENAAFDAASNDFFKFTVDLTDYHNLQLSFLERQKAGGGINGLANYAVAYQIGTNPRFGYHCGFRRRRCAFRRCGVGRNVRQPRQ